MLRSPDSAANFSIAQTRAIVRDLFRPSPVIFWADFLGTFFVGTICYALVRRVPPWSIWQALAFFASAVLYYRAALFVHELAHLRDGTFRRFRIVWNLLCGIPFLMPSFMYYSHVDHHTRKHYGTDHDGEYLPLASTGHWSIVGYLCQPLLIPLLIAVRFLILAPIGWFVPSFRRWIHVRASSLVMSPWYERPTPNRRDLQVFRLQETACFLLCFGVAVLTVRGRLPFAFLYQAYLTSVCALYLNHLRTLVAHRYTVAGGAVTFVDQLLDSVNYPDSRLTSLIWAPLGLRFHALHHLFPTLPYHNLEKAHRRLMAELPADSPYRQTNSPSLTASLRQLWRIARTDSSPAKSPAVAKQQLSSA